MNQYIIYLRSLIANMLIEKIREGTREKHQLLENQLFPYLNSIRTKEDYALLLTAFYGFMAPVEEMIQAYINPALVPDIAERRNANFLLKDLETIGNRTDIQMAVDLPVVNSNASAMGALYVLEGSTLGGKTISKMLGEALKTNEGLQFFSGYGPNTGYMWKKFMEYLQAPQLEAHADEVVKTATDTFSLFAEWLAKKLDK